MRRWLVLLLLLFSSGSAIADPAVPRITAAPLALDPADLAQVTRFGYRPPRGFCATDAAELPDGRLLVLNRRFAVLDGFAVAVTIIDPAAIAPGAVLVGEEIARLAPPLSVDNMEGLSITQDGGQTIVWIVSDDNFSPLERTLLMKFALLAKPEN